ncbi:MAG: calcium/sodium antiporter [Eubacteriaceae bacterium]|nr:calcium/sodium antiporter [Eubacteriaceae bacterium]
MGTLLIIILFILGLVLVIKGGSWFVDAATWLAGATGIPKFIIGATIVSFATTLPEVLVSAIASYQGHPDMAMGNAVGSVNCNTALIMALSIIFMGGKVKLRQFAPSGLIFLCATVLLYLFGADLSIVAWESAILMILCALSITDSIMTGRDPSEKKKKKKKKIQKDALTINIVKFAAGAVCMVVGARLLVDNGEKLAVILRVPDIIVSITLISVGTSLPELVTTITAIVKKQSDISIGNIIGANIMDLCVVVPLSSFIGQAHSSMVMTIDPSYLAMHIPVTIWLAFVAVIPTIIMKRFTKWQGILLLLSYVGYLVVSVMTL